MSENGLEQGQCGICYIQGPLHDIQNHFLQEHVADVSVSPENGFESPKNAEPCDDQRWSSEHVLLLIRLREQFDKQFEEGIKKNVWIKIANKMTEITGKNFTHEQVDSKWKGLKKTYKNIKDHNSKTGNTPKKWQFYNAMDSFMGKKPEIAPLATCSSTSSVIRIQRPPEEKENSSSDTSAVNIPTKRKKAENAAQKRHEQKMARFDKFLNLFKLSVENQMGKKISDDDAD